MQLLAKGNRLPIQSRYRKRLRLALLIERRATHGDGRWPHQSPMYGVLLGVEKPTYLVRLCGRVLKPASESWSVQIPIKQWTKCSFGYVRALANNIQRWKTDASFALERSPIPN